MGYSDQRKIKTVTCYLDRKKCMLVNAITNVILRVR